MKKPPLPRGSKLPLWQRVIIIAFIVIFALSSVAGAMASLFTRNKSKQLTPEEITQQIDGSYQAQADQLSALIETNPEDDESLLKLSDTYREWGASLSSFAVNDDARLHANEILQKAMSSYDTYLSRHDEPNVALDRAYCQFLLGEGGAATDAAQAIANAHPDNARAWAMVGMMQESRGNTQEARTAYERAVQADPDNTQSIRDSAQQRIDEIDNQANQPQQNVSAGQGVSGLMADATGASSGAATAAPETATTN